MTGPSSLPPISFLVDYDGTICLTQVVDEMMVRFAPSEEWLRLDAAYDRGEIGSRSELAQLVAWLPVEPEPVVAAAADQPHDETFAGFVALARAIGAEIEIVSDGYGFYVEPALARLGVTGLPIATAETSWATGRAEIRFPFGHPDCHLCGTCKRNRVLEHRARGRHVVLVGDGTSDRYAAAHADSIFAKAPLSGWCDEAGWAYRSWSTFDDVSAWLAAIVEDPERLDPPNDRGFICGPEVWGSDQAKRS